MALKSFVIDYEGRQEPIEYNDSIPYGVMDAIINQSVNLSDVSKIKINMAEYRLQILANVLTKAPFNCKDIFEIKKQDYKVVEQIMKEVMKDYPLTKFLEDWMTSFAGPEATID